jgi:hypothetical protein
VLTDELKHALGVVALAGAPGVLPGVAPNTEGEALRRITQSLGVAAALTLALAGAGTGVASAATHAAPTTKAQWQAAIAHVAGPGTGCYQASYPSLQWHAVKCVTAPQVPLAPGPATSTHRGPLAVVGDGNDYSATVTGLISQATGTFTKVSSNITEKGEPGGSGAKVANAFSLQLNSQFFASPKCSGSGDPANCLGWQQFVYTYQNKTSGYVFMQYWLINYDATCPSGWFTFSEDCYTNSASAKVSVVTAKQLASVKLVATAKSGGNDGSSLSVGSGQATLVTGKDTKVDLAAFWNTTEWGVFGDGGGSEAVFGANTSLEALTALTATSSGAPTCVKEGFTGETSNLKLASTPALGSEPSPTMGSRQTNGSTGTASCAVAS